MVRKLGIVFAAAVMGVCALPSKSQAAFKQGDFDLTLSGSGANDRDFRTFNVGATGSFGYFIADELEIGIRPSLNYGDGGSSWTLNTGAYVDYHFDLGNWQPYVGANIGYVFGHTENTQDGFSAGPEAGIKYFVNGTTYIYTNVQYEFNLNEGISSGDFEYGLGVGFRF